MDTPLATLEHGACKAEIYETALAGQFTIVYKNEKGEVLEEAELSGVSSYRQREAEILQKLAELCSGGQPGSGDLAAPGEY